MTEQLKSKHPLYFTWSAMIRRCADPNNERYAKRGISVCQRWLDDFWNFAADMGTRPAGHTLDRIDNDGNYEPTNCRWATYKTQNNNKQDQSPRITVNGRTLSIRELSKESGVPYATLIRRHKSGLKPDQLTLSTQEICRSIFINGQLTTLNEIAEQSGCTREAIRQRIKRGKTGSALLAPPDPAKQRR